MYAKSNLGEEVKVQLGHTLHTSRSKLENQGSAVSMSCENIALWVMQKKRVIIYSIAKISGKQVKLNTNDTDEDAALHHQV